MTETFKYVLTRVCLRSGQLTLPYAMLGLFPKTGTVVVIDAENNREYELSFPSQRNVIGLADYFREKELQVNDILLFQHDAGGRFDISVVPRPQKSVFNETDAIKSILSNFYQAGVSSSEAEIRATYPQIPDGFDLREALTMDRRLAFADGRWQPVERVRAEEAVMDEVSAESPKPLLGLGVIDEAPSYPKGLSGDTGDSGFGAEENDSELMAHNRAHFLFSEFGYSVEGITQRQLLVKTDLGRRKYQVFVYLLPPNERIDWSTLLSCRRDSGATYLCVVGDERDLERLHSPAELARASLWPWVGLERVQEFSTFVSLNPLDLEPFFERDGLLGRGIGRLEKSVRKRVGEMRAVDVILERLADMRAPSVFLLEDIVDVELPRDQLLTLLEYLAKAPFNLVSRVDNGEFCLHAPVPEALSQLSTYLLSVRDRFLGVEGETFVMGRNYDEAGASPKILKKP